MTTHKTIIRRDVSDRDIIALLKRLDDDEQIVFYDVTTDGQNWFSRPYEPSTKIWGLAEIVVYSSDEE